MVDARQPLRRVNREPTSRVFRSVGRIGGILLRATTRQDWRPGTAIPSTGGVIVVANHISNFDPVAVGHFVVWSGRWPRFLAKRELWDVPVLGSLMRALGQIPVSRNTPVASDALADAKAALRRGQCVVVYPEGTITYDPDGWPMTGRKGAALLALETGCPVFPLGQWGANEVMGFRAMTFPRVVPRRTMRMLVGAPLGGFGPEAHPDEGRALELTDAIMDRLTHLVGVLRGEAPPAGRFDSRVGQRVPPVVGGPEPIR
jgi:1-acyl-sn-glycerol-3-phosphate acyltransferase